LLKMALVIGFFGEVSSLIDCLTGTTFASGINKWAGERTEGASGNVWAQTARDVQIVRKPKPLPPIPSRPYSSFTQQKPKPPKPKGMLYADRSKAVAAYKGQPLRFMGKNGKVLIYTGGKK